MIPMDKVQNNLIIKYNFNQIYAERALVNNAYKNDNYVSNNIKD